MRQKKFCGILSHQCDKSGGASAPEILVQEVVEKIREIANANVSVSDMDGIVENTFFVLPRKVR
jgi:4-hydroxy-3-methylbut-2-enyl diphosphate reductase IspH